MIITFRTNSDKHAVTQSQIHATIANIYRHQERMRLRQAAVKTLKMVRRRQLSALPQTVSLHTINRT